MSKLLRSISFLFVAASLLLAACGTTSGSAPAASGNSDTTLPSGSVTLTGQGSSFQNPAQQQWISDYESVDPSVTISYNPTGSGAGKKSMVDNTNDFAGSDAVLTDQEMAAGQDLQLYPIMAGATVITYNLPELSSSDPALILDGQTLVDIYNAKVTMWNDPEITKLNPDIADKLPANQISVVHRADGSGTTEIFTNALTSFSSDWTSGAGSTVEWPVDKAGNGFGGNGNQGVTAKVQNTPDSLGYVEYAYAVQNKLPFAKMVNKDGKTVDPTIDSVKAAMSSGKFTPQLTATIVNEPGADSWPIAGYTYIILHTSSMTDCVKAQKLVEYVHWIVTDPTAIKDATDLDYAPLPDNVQQQVVEKLGEVTCNGQPVMK